MGLQANGDSINIAQSKVALESLMALQVETNRLLWALLLETGNAATHAEVGPQVNPAAYHVPKAGFFTGQRRIKDKKT
jgi:hypothetical protein